jgi:hypothetical protein
LPFLRDLHSNLAVIAVNFCQDDGVARGYVQGGEGANSAAEWNVENAREELE